MPEFSRFFGLVILMYYLDHNPPRFHVLCDGREALVSISPVEVLAGTLSRRALALTREWASIHEEELLAN
jgi:hypothetical protein